MGRKEIDVMGAINDRARKILEDKGLELEVVDLLPITGSYNAYYECPKCGRSGYENFRDVEKLKDCYCKNCKESEVEKVDSIEEINEYGVNYIDRSCDKTSIYYKGRLKRIWNRLRVDNLLCKEFKRYEDFRDWSIKDGYKPWKKLSKILKIDQDEVDKTPYGMSNSHWVSDDRIRGSKGEDTYANRVKLMGIMGVNSEGIKNNLNIVDNILFELEGSKYISKARVEKVMAISIEMNRLACELCEELDNMDIGKSRR